MRFLVIEGLDGSGKSTQLKLLRAYLDQQKIPFRYLHFPRLEEGVFGKLVARFLRGEFGSVDAVDPYLVALLFAGDRADAAGRIREWMDQGKLVIVDRYVYSNIAFQCAKLTSEAAQQSLRDWILDLEFRYHLLPRPDLNLFLDVPYSFVQKQLAGNREGQDREYLQGAVDIHEESMEFQEKVRKVYLGLETAVDDLRIIPCMDGEGNMRSPEAISSLIIDQIK